MTLRVTILTGFLGAGKTTLLKRLLREPGGERVGLIVNELGPTGIEAGAAPGGRAADYVELMEGCACCVLNPELASALRTMAARGDVDRVVLETTGLADPLPITWTLGGPDLEGVARLDAVVTVVDAANWERTQVEEWRAQVSCADLVVLSKLDLVDEAGAERARRAVSERNPAARIVTGGSEAPLGLLFDLERASEHAAARPPATPAPGGARHSRFGAVVIVAGGEVGYRPGPLEDLLEELPAPVFRAKGIARLAGAGWASFQVVGGRLDLDPDVAPPEHGESRLVFFGEDLDRAEMERLVARCRAD